MDGRSAKVAVIGAGIAGLAAAASLTEKGFDVYLLEAADYIGGRLKQAEVFPGFPPVDLGGGFIHGSRNIALQIAKENGWKLKKCDGEDPKTTCVFLDGKFYSFQDYAAHPDFLAAYKAWDEIIAYGYQVNCQAKETTTVEEESDDQQKSLNSSIIQDQIEGVSFEDWLFNKGSNQATIGIIDSLYCQTCGGSLKHAGVLEMAVYEHLWDQKFGAENYRLEESYSILLSHYLNKCANVDKRLNWPVKEITWKDNHSADHGSPNAAVHITNQHGESLHVKYAVITVPLTVLKDGDIHFLPVLPASKQQAIQSIYMGAALKIVCRFKTRFWGDVVQHVYCPRNFILQVWMYSRDPKPDGDECHVLVGFQTATAAAQKVHLSDEEICQRFVQQLDAMYGNTTDPNPASRNLMNYVYYHWSKHPYIRGGYSCPTVNSHGLLKELAEPVEGRLFFAGEATNVTSTVNSALESGLRAAEEVYEVDVSLKSKL